MKCVFAAANSDLYLYVNVHTAGKPPFADAGIKYLQAKRSKELTMFRVLIKQS